MEKKRVLLTSKEVIERVFEEILKESSVLKSNFYRNCRRCSDTHESCKCGHEFKKVIMIRSERNVTFLLLGHLVTSGRGCSKEPKKIKLLRYTIGRNEGNLWEKLEKAITESYRDDDKLEFIMEGDVDQPLTLKVKLPKVRPLNFTDARLKKDTRYEEKLVEIITQCLLEEANH